MVNIGSVVSFTFLRQKVTLASSVSTPIPVKGGKKDLQTKNETTVARDSKNCHHLEESAVAERVEDLYSAKSECQNAIIAKDDCSAHVACIYAPDSHQFALFGQSQGKGVSGFFPFPPEKSIDLTELSNHHADAEDLSSPRNTVREDSSTSDIDQVTDRKTVHNSSKVNENTNGAGVLRYALHLRFLCPAVKKCSRSMQRCKSDPLSNPHANSSDIDGERRFYLYNDLRVVFPQRHSDADEGKIVMCQVQFVQNLRAPMKLLSTHGKGKSSAYLVSRSASLRDNEEQKKMKRSPTTLLVGEVQKAIATLLPSVDS
ncbi:hypothetical protein ACLOJK_018930 [Asimina triloba]